MKYESAKPAIRTTCKSERGLAMSVAIRARSETKLALRTTERLRWLAGLALASSCAFACSSNPSTPGTSTTPATSTAGHAATSGVGATSTAGTTGVSVGTPVAGITGSAATGGLGATAGTSAAGSTAASGSGGSNAAPPDADAGPTPDASTPASTGTLPAITDLTVAGPFTPKETDMTGPSQNYTIIAPAELGKNGIKHPIVVWGPGAGASPAIYQTLLNNFASQGFVVISYNSTPQGPELTTGIDWIVAENARQGSMFYNMLDTTKIAAAGQSAGSLAVFKIANDKRLTTTLHINGGTFAPHTDAMNLVVPAQFICGDDPSATGGDGLTMGDLARPNCDVDFMNATTPVWYGDVIGASHTTVIDNPLSMKSAADTLLMKQFFAGIIAWLRWQLAGDQTMKAMFVGADCGFCKETSAWKVQQKNLQ